MTHHKQIIAALAAAAALASPCARADYVWSGAVDNNFFTAGNWRLNGGSAATSLSGNQRFVFNGAGATVEYEPAASNTGFAIAAIEFGPQLSGPVTITGQKMASVGSVVNESAYVNVFSNEVHFSETVNLTGSTRDVAFWGGVDGTFPEGHTNFVGKYTLTASKWTLHNAVRIAENSSLSGTFLEIATHGSGRLLGGEGCLLDVNQISHADSASFSDECGQTGMAAGELFGDFRGDVIVRKLDFEKSHQQSVGPSFTGTLTAGCVWLDGGSSNVPVPFSFTGSMVIGDPGSADYCGFRMKTGDFRFIGNPFRLRASRNFEMSKIRATATDTRENGFYIPSGSKLLLEIDAGRTVSAYVPSARWNLLLIRGDGAVEATGDGTFWLKNACQFKGGMTVSSNATLKLEGNAHPGEGNLALKDSATLLLNSPMGGTVDVAGDLSLSPDSTIVFNNINDDAPPLCVGNRVYVSGTGSPTFRVTGDSTLSDGVYCLMSAAEIDSAIDIDQIALEVPSSLGSNCSLTKIGGALLLCVGNSTTRGIWTGLGMNNQMNNPVNWFGGNDGIPRNGDRLLFYSVGRAKDIDVGGLNTRTFSTIMFGAGVCTFHGNLNVEALTNAFKLAVASDCKLTVNSELFVNRSGVFLYSNEGTVIVNGRARADIRSLSDQYVYQYALAREGYVKPIAVDRLEYFCRNRDTPDSPEGTRGQLMWTLGSQANQPGSWVIHTNFVFSQCRDAAYSTFGYWGSSATTLYSSGDWTLPDGNGNNGGDMNTNRSYGEQGTLVLDTSDYFTGAPRTLTVTGCISDSNPSTDTPRTNVVVRGCGRLVIDTGHIKNYGISQHLLVEDGATLFLNPDRWISTPDRGTVALAAGGMLGWQVSTKTTIELSERTCRSDVRAIQLPPEGVGYIRLEGEKLPYGTYHLLTFLPDGWREHLSVNGSAVQGRRVRLVERISGLWMKLEPLPFDIILR